MPEFPETLGTDSTKPRHAEAESQRCSIKFSPVYRLNRCSKSVTMNYRLTNYQASKSTCQAATIVANCSMASINPQNGENQFSPRSVSLAWQQLCGTLKTLPPMMRVSERLAKPANMAKISRTEKRYRDVGNYKYEVISLSERLSKAEYDLRVNFEIPKGTKLAAGLNLVEVNLDGLPGVKQVERDAPAPRPEMTPRKPNEDE